MMENESRKKSRLRNVALIFIKPHANNPEVQKLVRTKLLENDLGLKITYSTEIDSAHVEDANLIDQHYFSIASKATLLPPKNISVPEDKFENFFHEKWTKVLKENRAANALQACKMLECTEDELEAEWRTAEENGKIAKFGGGFYCGKIKSLYVFNAFFMSMRAKYIHPNASIYCFRVEWDPLKLSWADFRGNLIGSTDPSKASVGSIRRTIFERFEDLGLTKPPDKGDNGIHASASPFEGLVELHNWMGKNIIDIDFGKALLSRGLTASVLSEWFRDPIVKYPRALENGKTEGSLFDYVEDTDAVPCMNLLVKLYDFQLDQEMISSGCKCTIS